MREWPRIEIETKTNERVKLLRDIRDLVGAWFLDERSLSLSVADRGGIEGQRDAREAIEALCVTVSLELPDFDDIDDLRKFAVQVDTETALELNRINKEKEE